MPRVKGHYRRTKSGKKVWVKPHHRKPKNSKKKSSKLKPDKINAGLSMSKGPYVEATWESDEEDG